MSDIERKPAFMLGDTGDGAKAVFIGVPKTAFDDMTANGTSCDFDFRSVGIPLVLVIFTGADHSACMAEIENIGKALNIPILDERRRDFSVKSASHKS